MNLFKWLNIPSGETIKLMAYESWTVRWIAPKHYYEISFNGKEKVEVFTNEEDANKFADEIKKAFELTKSSCIGLSVKKNK